MGHPHESIRHTHDTHGLCRSHLPSKPACGPTLGEPGRGLGSARNSPKCTDHSTHAARLTSAQWVGCVAEALVWDRRFEHEPHLDLILQEVHCELLIEQLRFVEISGSESVDPA